MSNKLYVIADKYFEDCAFATKDKYVAKMFMRHKPRHERYELITLTDEDCKKDFKKKYTNNDLYSIVNGEVLLGIERSIYQNIVPCYAIKLQEAIRDTVAVLDYLKFEDDEKEDVIKALKLLFKYSQDRDSEFLNNRKTVCKFIHENRGGKKYVQ